MNFNIVLLSTSLGMGGADQQVIYLAQALLAKGYKVKIVALVPLGQMGLEAQNQGLPIYSLNMNKGIPEPTALFKLIKLLRQWKPQIVHSHMFHANLIARIARILTPIDVLVCTAHNIKEGRRWREIIYRWTDSLSDLMTQVSQAGMKRYLEVGAVSKHKIQFVPNVVDIQKFQPNPEVRNNVRQKLNLVDKFVWLAVGRNHEQKDYSNMIKAFALVSNQFKNATLMIAGDGLLGSEIESLTKNLGIQSQVQFLGVRRDVPALMNAADAYLMSSAWEGMPVVLLEASASGLPIVATDVGGNGEVVLDKKTGFLVPPHNSEALAKAMQTLMELPLSERQKMGQLSREYIVDHHSCDRVVNNWINLYSKLLINDPQK